MRQTFVNLCRHNLFTCNKISKTHQNYYQNFQTNNQAKYILKPAFNSLKLTYKFSNNQKDEKDNQNSKQITKSKEQIMSALMGFQSYKKLKNDLVVSQERYQQNTKQLKQAILFEDLLKNQVHIEIYNTNGKPFYSHLIKSLFMVASIIGTVFAIEWQFNNDTKFRVYTSETQPGKYFLRSVLFMIIVLSFVVLIRHLRFTKRFVDKIVYNTQKEQFTFTKRTFLCTKKDKNVSRYKVLYTENPQLNKKGTNYLNIDNLEEFQIGYDFAWKKQDLFSHLISQRINKSWK